MRSHLTRMIHLLLLALVLHQLIGAQFIRLPFPGDPPGWSFSLHEYLGMANLGVVVAFWVWAVVRRRETRIGRLVPWFSAARLGDVAADVTAQLHRLAHGRAPDDENGAFASATHGLGLLVVTAMAVTGIVFFFADGTPFGHTVLGLHKLMAKLVWAYLFGHAGLAAIHHLLGSDILSRMFWTGRRRFAEMPGRHGPQRR